MGYKVDKETRHTDQKIFIRKANSIAEEENATLLFNGGNLDGWNTYIQTKKGDIATATDFFVEENMIHVIGKNAGYIITEKSYENYHLKVELKWGIKKWPPRLDSPRDAGICYHIPFSETDKIFPASVKLILI